MTEREEVDEVEKTGDPPTVKLEKGGASTTPSGVSREAKDSFGGRSIRSLVGLIQSVIRLFNGFYKGKGK